MDEAVPAGTARYSRFWLYTPFVLLLLIAVGWSAAWFVIRNRASEAVDAWFATEARAGRQWTCQDRTIAGYPFRIELICNSLSLKQGAVTASLGRVESVAQVYQPRFIITEIEGPLKVTDGQVTVQGSWDLLQTSFHAEQNGFRRLSLVAEAPRVTVAGLAPGEIATSGQHLELHVRPNPSRSAEKAYDAALSIRQTAIPVLDALVGGSERTDIDSDLTVTQAEGFRGRPIAEELERWRSAGGKLDVLMLSLAKGSRRAEAKGELRLDEMHRPAGQLTLAAAGLDGLLDNVMGRRNGALLSALLGQGGAAPGQQANGRPALSPLPPVRLENGRLAFGPFVIPNITLPAIY